MPESKKRKRDITLFLVIATLYVTNYNVFIKGKKKTFYSETKTDFLVIFLKWLSRSKIWNISPEPVCLYA